MLQIGCKFVEEKNLKRNARKQRSQLGNGDLKSLTWMESEIFFAPTCFCHSLVRLLECQYRIASKKGHLKTEYSSIPKFSIQHMIDRFDPTHTVESVEDVTDLLENEGVTLESNYEFAHGSINKKKETHPDWPLYKSGFCDLYFNYDLKNYRSIRRLMKIVDNRGGFGARYILRSSHHNVASDAILKPVGKFAYDIDPKRTPKKVKIGHQVQVCGYKGTWCMKKEKWIGFWKILNSWGEKWCLNGAGKIDFGLVEDVVVMSLPKEVFRNEVEIFDI